MSFSIPKYRKKAIFGVTKKRLGDVFHELARRRESKIEGGHRMPDPVHMFISVPPKYSVAEVIGFIKGEEFDLDRAECRAQSAQFHGAQVLGSGLFRLDGRAGRGNPSGLHQEPRAARSRIGPACSHPIDPHPKVAESFKTAFSGSPPYHQLSWWLLT